MGPPFLRRAQAWWQWAVAVGALALVVAVTTAVFSIISGAVFRPLPIKDIETLGHVTFTEGGAVSARGFSATDVARLEPLTSNVLTELVGVDFEQVALTLSDVSHTVAAENFSGPYFEAFQVPMLLGRAPARDVNASKDCCVAVISERLWRSNFAADPEILGTSIMVAGRPFAIVGVVSQSFRGVLLPQLISVDAWISRDQLPENARHVMQVFGRLRSGVSFADVRANVRAGGAGFDPEDPQVSLDFLPAWRGMIPPPLVAIGAAIAAVSVAVCAIVLLLGAATVVNLAMAGFVSRRREFAVRIALGAQAKHLARQARIESMAVTIPGCIAGALLAGLVLRVLSATVVLPAAGALIPRIDATPDVRVLSFVVASFALLTILLARSHVRAMWADPSVLAGGVRQESVADSVHNLKPVTWQLAVATTLLIVAVLFLRNVDHVNRIATFSSEHLVVAHVRHDSSTPQGGRAAALMEPIVKGALAPGVRVALATSLPLPGRFGLSRAGVTPGARVGATATVHVVGITDEFLSVLGLPMVHGQGLTRASSDREDQTVVDETTAEMLWPNANPLGQRVWLAGSDRSLTVVGVARAPVDRSGSASLRAFLFVPIETVDSKSFEVLLTGPGSDQGLETMLREYVKRADPSALLFDVRALRDYADPYSKIAAASSMPAVIASLLTLVLTLASLYALTSQDVAGRMSEFGVRVALGATPWSLHRLILGQYLGVIVRGSAFGALGGVGSALLLPLEFIHGLRAADIWLLAALPLASLGICVVAALPAAYRATRSNPLKLIRS